MNIHEHQAKEILKEFGAPVSNGIVILSLDSIIPPSDFSPNTPPEHNLIYSHMYNND